MQNLKNLTIKIVFIVSFISALSSMSAQSTNWSETVAPILYKNCTSCHHTGGVAPFSLMTYQEVKNMKLAIHHAVEKGHMPPWPPDLQYSQLARPRALNEADKKALLDWAIGSAEQGNPANAPVPPTYTGVAFISNPHLLVRIPLYEVSSNRDDYRCFPIKSGLTVDKFISSMEVIPGNNAIVHHVLIFQDQANTCFDLDAKDTAPGYTSFGGIGSPSAQLIGAWVPGSQPYVLPKGMGIKLKANANIVLQVHYAPGSAGQSDSTHMRLKFTEGTLREVNIAPILNHVFSLTNGPLFIPANTVKTFNAQFVMPGDVTIISIAPHMHLIAKSMKSFAVTPRNDTIKLIKIDHWDFHWQGSYLFKKAVKLPRGSFLKSETIYDNTASNEHQPSNPPKDVSLGENTTDEMMLIYFTYLVYRAGDENIDLEEATTTSVFDPPLSITPLSCFPNPTAGSLTLRFSLEKKENLNIQIFDYQGVISKSVSTEESFTEGKNEKTFSVFDLPKGFYFVKISSDKIYGVQQFIKID